MSRPAQSTRRAALKADAAADQLADWLRQRHGTGPDGGSDTPGVVGPSAADAPTTTCLPAPPADVDALPGSITHATREADGDNVKLPMPRDGVADVPIAIRLRPTDWLHHRMAVTGPAEAVAEFQDAAHGAGVIPWRLDFGQVEEDLFHLLAAPPAPQRRRLGLAGARVLAGQLREAVALRYDIATARVGHSRACPLDLHALHPVPPEVLQLGPDHPHALAWLWSNWGTTAGLRHVALEPSLPPRASLPAGDVAFRLSFWSADWTPWRALAAVAARWPALRLDVRPTYGAP